MEGTTSTFRSCGLATCHHDSNLPVISTPPLTSPVTIKLPKVTATACRELGCGYVIILWYLPQSSLSGTAPLCSGQRPPGCGMGSMTAAAEGAMVTSHPRSCTKDEELFTHEFTVCLDKWEAGTSSPYRREGM